MSVLVEVTQEDIENGVLKEPESCPVALAVRRYMAGGKSVSVYDNEIWVGFKRFNAPRSVTRFVKAFDKNLPVKPFRFRLKPSWNF